METMVVVNGMTAHRANVIFARTGSAAMGCVKAQMIDLLKAKLQSGVAHFLYKKQSTQEIREAWGTCSHQLMKATQNGRGLRFCVQGFKYTGIVEVVYVEGKDLFEVVLTNNGTKVEDIYLDNLVSVIDNLVEKTSNYKQSVKKVYSLN